MRESSSADETVPTTSVPAESAPIGVQLWPTRGAEFAPNYTLAEVVVTRNAAGGHVAWLYESGNTRYFYLGEMVAVWNYPA